MSLGTSPATFSQRAALLTLPQSLTSFLHSSVLFLGCPNAYFILHDTWLREKGWRQDRVGYKLLPIVGKQEGAERGVRLLVHASGSSGRVREKSRTVVTCGLSVHLGNGR